MLPVEIHPSDLIWYNSRLKMRRFDRSARNNELLRPHTQQDNVVLTNDLVLSVTSASLSSRPRLALHALPSHG